jgi:hypothetical protein
VTIDPFLVAESTNSFYLGYRWREPLPRAVGAT